LKSVRTGDGLDSTIETYPEYGKYHEDGHRVCGVHINYKDSKKLNGICPKCKKPLTIGVEYRIEELAKEPIGYKPEGAKPFIRTIPLLEIIAIVLGKGLKTKTVSEVYDKLVRGRTEFDVLLRLNRDELIKLCDNEKLVDVILISREGNLKLKPGYDGVYGKIIYNGEATIEEPTDFVKNEQKSLGEY
jgi:PHP family Zn ribbon phosphoesterase